MTPFDLTDKCALITGASGVIGSAIATVLHTHGATIALSGTRAQALENLAQKLDPTRTSLFPADLKNTLQTDNLIKDVEKKLDHIDILINNAGITRDNLSIRMKDEEWDDVLQVNLNAVFRLIRGVLRSMMKRRYGRIISITSVVGHTGNPGQINYCTTKAGLTGMTKALAAEVAARGITVNCVAPGLITSPMTQKLTPEQQQRLISFIPIGRMGTPEEIATAVVYLASNEASYITGQTLHINGGMAML